MTKIINIHTGEERTYESPELPECEVCEIDVDVRDGGISGKIGYWPVSFCEVCLGGIVRMLVERQSDEKDS